MEYDRSLYRVYERVMEDLNASPPVIASRTQRDEDILLPYCFPLTFIEFINKLFHLRYYCFFSIPWQIRSISHSNYGDISAQHEYWTNENINPLYSHHARRIQMRMGEHRRALLGVNDQNSHSNRENRGSLGLNNEENSITIDAENPPSSSSHLEYSGNIDIHQTFSSSSSSTSSVLSLNSLSSSSSSSVSATPHGSNLTTNTIEETRGHDRRRRERRMRRRQARMNEPIEQTLRRIRNRQFGSTSNINDNDTVADATDDSSGCTQKKLYWAMQCSMLLGIFHLIVLFILHSTYVGAGVWQNRMRFKNHDNSMILPKTCLEYALQTRPASKRSSYGEANNDAYANMTLREIQERRPLLGADEILQIKIIYGGVCSGQCSKIRTVIPKKDKNETTSENNSTNLEKSYESYGSISSEYFSSAEYWETPDYRYSSMDVLLFVEKEFKLDHNFSVINVTLTERCLSTGNDYKEATVWTKFAEILSQAYGMDAAIINQLMYGIRELPPPSKKIDDNEKAKKKQKSKKKDDEKLMYRSGRVQNMVTSEQWNWSQEFLELSDYHNPVSWLFDKVGILVASSLSFFFVTSVTSLIVRVLTGSGVVLMFPLFYLFRMLGIPGADDRILGRSYPWIGRPYSAIQQQNLHPFNHLVWAHVAKMLLYYVMYEGCQASWSGFLYGKSIPETMPVWIFGMAMFWEYFSMVFVRSALSVFFFPRITLIYYICFHVYFYSIPYGYFDIALIPLFFFMIQAMLYTILALELPAASRGAVNFECPREVYNRLSWPEWTGSLPVEWTLFLPLNSRYIPLHDRVIDVERVADADEDILDDEDDDDDEIEEENDEIESSFDRGEAIVEPVDLQSVTRRSRRSGLHVRRTGASSTSENESMV